MTGIDESRVILFNPYGVVNPPRPYHGFRCATPAAIIVMPSSGSAQEKLCDHLRFLFLNLFPWVSEGNGTIEDELAVR